VDNQKKKLFQFLSFASRKAELLPFFSAAASELPFCGTVRTCFPIKNCRIVRTPVSFPAGFS
jgi:hypothetical protein